MRTCPLFNRFVSDPSRKRAAILPAALSLLSLSVSARFFFLSLFSLSENDKDMNLIQMNILIY